MANREANRERRFATRDSLFAVRPSARYREGGARTQLAPPSRPNPDPTEGGGKPVPGSEISRGRAQGPPPGFVPPAGATNAGVTGPIWLPRRKGATKSSRAAERHCDKLRGLARLHPQQHGALAALACVVERDSNVGRARYGLAGDLEDHVAGLEAALGGRAVGIDGGDDHALAAAAGDRAGGGQRQAEMGLGTGRPL